MHELPVTESIVKIVCDEAEKHKIHKIDKINIKVGELSGLIPDCIQYYFDILSKGTAAEGAELVLHKIPISMKCNNCGAEFELSASENNSCVNCDSDKLVISHGNEFYIQSMEVDEHGNTDS